MGFNIRPKLDRFVPTSLSKGWGVIDLSTGEVLKGDQKNRIERYAHKKWAQTRCDQLNKTTEKEKCNKQ